MLGYPLLALRCVRCAAKSRTLSDQEATFSGYVLLLHVFDAAVLLLGRTLSNCDAHFDRGSPHRDASGLRARDDCGPCRGGNPFDEEFDDRAARMINRVDRVIPVAGERHIEHFDKGAGGEFISDHNITA